MVTYTNWTSKKNAGRLKERITKFNQVKKIRDKIQDYIFGTELLKSLWLIFADSAFHPKPTNLEIE